MIVYWPVVYRQAYPAVTWGALTTKIFMASVGSAILLAAPLPPVSLFWRIEAEKNGRHFADDICTLIFLYITPTFVQISRKICSQWPN